MKTSTRARRDPVEAAREVDRPRKLEGTGPAPLSGLSSAGRPLDAGPRAEMERRFGHDLSRVRVHADDRAAGVARGHRARAFAVGHDVVFGAGEYRPGTAQGRSLLAHELAHVVQQSIGGPGPPGPEAEREAERASDLAGGEGPIPVWAGTAVGVAKKSEEVQPFANLAGIDPASLSPEQRQEMVRRLTDRLAWIVKHRGDSTPVGFDPLTHEEAVTRAFLARAAAIPRGPGGSHAPGSFAGQPLFVGRGPTDMDSALADLARADPHGKQPEPFRPIPDVKFTPKRRAEDMSQEEIERPLTHNEMPGQGRVVSPPGGFDPAKMSPEEREGWIAKLRLRQAYLSRYPGPTVKIPGIPDERETIEADLRKLEGDPKEAQDRRRKAWEDWFAASGAGLKTPMPPGLPTTMGANTTAEQDWAMRFEGMRTDKPVAPTRAEQIHAMLEAADLIIGFIPVVGTGLQVIEAAAGYSLAGDKLSTGMRAFMLATAMIPAASKIVRLGKAAAGARALSRIASQTGRTVEEAGVLVGKLDGLAGERKLLEEGAQALRAGKAPTPAQVEALEHVAEATGARAGRGASAAHAVPPAPPGPAQALGQAGHSPNPHSKAAASVETASADAQKAADDLRRANPQAGAGGNAPATKPAGPKTYEEPKFDVPESSLPANRPKSWAQVEEAIDPKLGRLPRRVPDPEGLTGVHQYRVDATGRPVMAEGLLYDISAVRNKYQQSKLSSPMNKVSGKGDFNASHLLPREFGGSGGRNNLVNLVNEINQRAVRDFERWLGGLVRDPANRIYLQAYPIYGRGATAPVAIQYLVYKIENGLPSLIKEEMIGALH